MIQELSGGGGLVEERKFTIPGALLFDHGHSTSSSSAAAPSITPYPPAENQNLRCPRCDSSNTKFCYYNNYNLTQPRHFCKTCRRYWTKGGALRNVPIGGGCRKSKNPGGSVGVPACKSGGSKARPDVNNAGGGMTKPSIVCGGGNGFRVHDPPNTAATAPILWASSHGSNYLLSLLKDSNPNPSSGAVRMEDVTDATLVANALSTRALGPEHRTGLAPSTGLCTPPLMWKNNHYQYQQQNNTMLFGTEVQSSGIGDLHQRLSSTTTTNNCIGDYSQVYMGNVASSPLLPRATTATTISTTTAAVVATAYATASVMESINPVTTAGGHEFGIWNLPMSWSDVPTTNVGFP